MKSLKPFVFVLAGMLITVALFSFKNESPKKEYLTLFNNTIITRPDLTQEKILLEKGDDDQKKEIRIINNLLREGWELKFTLSHSPGYRTLYFERVKQ